MKIKKGSFKTTKLIGGLVGGVAAGAVSSFMSSSDSLTVAAVDAVAGAAVSAFVGGDLMDGVGMGMIGVAGSKLASQYIFNSETTTTKTEGVGLIPGNYAVMAAARNARPWVKKRSTSTNGISSTNNVTL